jgi:CheY-like chemotaxis protein
MVESTLSFYDAKRKLEEEITDRQKHLVAILENLLPHSATERELLEREIESRWIAIEKLDSQICDRCGAHVDVADALHIRITEITKYDESLPPTKVRVRAECDDCLRATKEEIIQAVRVMPFSQEQDLKRFAYLRMRVLGRASLGRTGDDLFQEAMESTLLGADNPEAGRHWYKNRVDFYGHLKGVIQSISDHWRGKYKEESEPLLEAEIIQPNAECDCSSPLDDIASSQPSVEQYLIAKEEVERLFKRFSDDEPATAILQAQDEGQSAEQVMQEQGLTARQYGAALRRIQSQKSVLIVDEYDQMLGLLSRWLKAMNYAVVTASTAAEGLRLYRECSPFDVVIISHSLDLNGVELATDIRKRNQSQNLILTTPYPDEEDVFRRNPPEIHRHGPLGQAIGSQLTTAIRPRELVHVPVLKKPFLRMELVANLERFTTQNRQSCRNREGCRQRKHRSTKPRKPVLAFSRVKQTPTPSPLS